MAAGRKKIVKVNQTMSFSQVIPEWVETISNLKMLKHLYIAIIAKGTITHKIIAKGTITHKIQSAYFRQQNLSIFTSCP